MPAASLEVENDVDAKLIALTDCVRHCSDLAAFIKRTMLDDIGPQDDPGPSQNEQSEYCHSRVMWIDLNGPSSDNAEQEYAPDQYKYCGRSGRTCGGLNCPVSDDRERESGDSDSPQGRSSAEAVRHEHYYLG